MQDWQQQLAQAITTPDALCEMLDLDIRSLDQVLLGKLNFPLRVPKPFVERMKKGDPQDPLLLQALPLMDENRQESGYSKSPLDENNHNPVPGLLHKYHGRVLLTVTGACAINCRYCFRRHFPYEENAPQTNQWKPVLNYIRENQTIQEVILSGGDPLVLKDRPLTHLIESIAEIPHVKTLRIHTRLPIMIPSRITDDFVDALSQTRLNAVLVIHANHPQELDHSVAAALDKLRDKKVTLLNQSVLLKKINDDSKTLIRLSERLFEIGVLPYYLHLLDPVEGGAHFNVDETTGKSFIEALRARLPGYLVPKLVREIPGEPSKTPL